MTRPMRAISARRSVRCDSRWYCRAFSIAIAAWRANRVRISTSRGSKRRGGRAPTPKNPIRRPCHEIGRPITAWSAYSGSVMLRSLS